ncbi:Transcriptional Crp Fnr family [Micractinium conductrix]|uniref:Transcriptional Crp Fnr family n=1 Tax=Micractinium conductrix TaxID=554055 RepID=A0A2P6VEE3_9CHLO|nr:Transcriptional Crp Fnr family [Micractinium conductrix]|eukprot:PSC72441.1 Transcriptional Crp Fnr family [Micractinium conductrix]
MVQVLNASSIWVQLGSFCFLLSGLFGDLLLIRLSLVMAYLWMLTAAATGYPIWPNVSNPGFIGVDGITWSILNLFFHGVAFARLVWDERRVRFRDPSHERLWRFFYRRSGMGRLEFKETIKRASCETFRAGDVIMQPADTHTRLMLLVEGLATFKVRDPSGNATGDVPLVSGGCFDIGLLNVLGVYIAFEKHEHERITVTAVTDCEVVFWELEQLSVMATLCSPALSSFWRNFTLCQVGLEWYGRQYRDRPLVNARGLPEPAGVVHGTAVSSDFSDPLQSYEDPSPTLRGVLAWLPTTLAPFLPPGMRHTAMPRAGALARNRLIALGAAHRSEESMLKDEPPPLRQTSRAVLRSISRQAASLCAALAASGDAGSTGGVSPKGEDGLV